MYDVQFEFISFILLFSLFLIFLLGSNLSTNEFVPIKVIQWEPNSLRYKKVSNKGWQKILSHSVREKF